MKKPYYLERSLLSVKFLLVIIALIVVSIPIWLSYQLHNKMLTEERMKMQLWASSVEALSSNDEKAPLNVLLSVVSSNHTIPVILCDDQDSVISFNNIPLEKVDTLQQLQNYLKEYKASYAPIKIDLGDKGNQYLYYSNSSTLEALYIFPSIQVLVFLFFVILLLFSFYLANKNAQNKLWVGLCKETAHQLGTPISSLMAWIELLEVEAKDQSPFEEMKKDTERLRIIAHRFQKMGSESPTEKIDLKEELNKIVHYMERRISKGVVMETHYSSLSPIWVSLDPSLWSWVVENLIKNAVDAMEGRGKIELSLETKDNSVYFVCSDTGKGISKRNKRKIFRAGFTTKRNGWGLGLSLVKRIVEQSLRGSIILLYSELGVGTAFRIKLPIVKDETIF